jgi:hypothetical protein
MMYECVLGYKNLLLEIGLNRLKSERVYDNQQNES